MLQKKPSVYLVLALLLLLGTGLRCYRLDAFGLGGDEKYALLVGSFIYQEGGNQHEILRNESQQYFTNKQLVSPTAFDDFQLAIASRDNGSGATYDLILNQWIKLFGVSDFAVRSLSVLFNILTILLVFVFAKTWTGNSKIALLATFLAVISPFYVVVSQVARGYSLLFLLALLSTHLLLLFYRKNKIIYLAFYSIIVYLALQTHYSIFPLFFIHGLYVLAFHRKFKPMFAFSLSMTFPFVGMLLWLNSTGGQWAFHSIEQSAIAYNKMVIEAPYKWLQVTTWATATDQLWREFTLTFPVFHNLGESLLGTKNFLFSLVISVIFGFVFVEKSISLKISILAILIVLVVQFFLITVDPLQFMLFSLLLSVSFFLLTKLRHLENKALKFSLVIVVLSHVFLVLFAFKDGNTMRIIPRYSGYGYAFSCVLVASAVFYLWKSKVIIKFALLLIFGISTLLHFQIFGSIYVDRPANYFHQFPEPRIENPYYSLAETVAEIYVQGDTLILPSAVIDTTYGGFEIAKYSVQDAQYLNIYLSRKDPEITQRIDRSEPNKVILKHADGTFKILFDFEGTRYRY